MNNYTRFEPWFGDWPPKFKRESERGEMCKINNKWTWFSILGFVIIAIIGGLLVSISTNFWHEFGFALIISGVIGFIIELTFVTQLAQRVFEISFGYLLPQELKPGLRWIYGQKILCVKHEQTFKIMIHPTNAELVIIETEIKRTFQNISGSIVDFTPSFSIEEYFRKEGNSEIIQMSYCIDGGEYVELNNKKTRSLKGNLDIGCQKIKMGSGSKIETSSISTVIKNISDIFSWHFTYATKEPEVIVEIPDSLDYQVGFEYAEDKEIKPYEIRKDRWKLPTTILPKQPISIHWWQKDRIEEWLKNN